MTGKEVWERVFGLAEGEVACCFLPKWRVKTFLGAGTGTGSGESSGSESGGGESGEDVDLSVWLLAGAGSGRDASGVGVLAVTVIFLGLKKLANKFQPSDHIKHTFLLSHS